MAFVNKRIEITDREGKVRKINITLDEETGIFLECVELLVWDDDKGFVGALHLKEKIIGFNAIKKSETLILHKMSAINWSIEHLGDGYGPLCRKRLYDGSILPVLRLSTEEKKALIPVILEVMCEFGDFFDGNPADWEKNKINYVAITRYVKFDFCDQAFLNPQFESTMLKYGVSK